MHLSEIRNHCFNILNDCIVDFLSFLVTIFRVALMHIKKSFAISLCIYLINSTAQCFLSNVKIVKILCCHYYIFCFCIDNYIQNLFHPYWVWYWFYSFYQFPVLHVEAKNNQGSCIKAFSGTLFVEKCNFLFLVFVG